MPPQAAPDEAMRMSTIKAKEPCEQKLFFKERTSLLSSNCVYQIQKVNRLFITFFYSYPRFLILVCDKELFFSITSSITSTSCAMKRS